MTGSVIVDFIDVQDRSIVTISSGQAVLSRGYHRIAAETGTTDDLSQLILSPTGLDYPFVILEADTGDTITVKHGVNNIYLNGATDFTLDANKRLLLHRNGTNWTDVGAGGGGGGAAIDVYEDGVSVVASADKLDFKDFNIEDLGSNDAGIWHNLPAIAGGRLTLTSGTAVTTSDVTAATTLYYTPHIGEQISLWDGTRWRIYTFSERSIAVPATTNTMYDVFLYDNAGTLTLELTAWTDDTTRATALTTQNGVLVKSGAATRKYLGSFRTTGVSGQTEDSLQYRLAWNYYNRAVRKVRVVEATNSWTYSTATWRPANNNTANRVGIVQGVSEDCILLTTTITFSHTLAGGFALSGIAQDATNTSDIDLATLSDGKVANRIANSYREIAYNPTPGYHDYYWTEYVGNGATGTIYSLSGVLRQSGILGWVKG